MKTHGFWQFEIRTHDLARTADFYRSVFDWEIVPLGPGLVLADTGRTPGIWLTQTASSEVPVGVVPYVEVPDCEAAAASVVDNGGRVLLPKTQSGAAGFWSHALDPYGNELAFWEKAAPAPPYVGSGRNPLIWHEIPTLDLATSVRFYKRVCGWNFQIDAHVEDFAFWAERNQPMGVGLVGGERAKLFTAATFYVRVTDALLTRQRALEAGATIRAEVSKSPDGKTFMVLADPNDLPFGLEGPPQ